jgi:hypothetical protein
LPAFALAGSRGVVAFLLIVSAAGSALAWWIGWLTSRRADAAWLAWATVTVPVTAVFHSFSVYPDSAGGVLALTGLWALLRADEEQRTASERIAPWFWHGLALAILPWLQSRFAAIAGTLGALILLRLSSTRSPAAKAVAFLSIPALSAVLWLGFFIALYGRPDPSAPYPIGEMGSFQWIPGGLLGLLFDQRFGLLPYAPVLAFAFAGLAVMAARPATRRLAVELLFVMVPYLLTVTHFAMWWGGWSAPARFFAPVLPLLAAPAAILWLAVSESGRRERPLVLAALIFTMFTTAILVVVDGGRLAYNLRDNPSLWLEWLSGPSNLAQALPWWTRGSDWTLLRDVGIWIAACLGVVVIVRVAASRPAFRDRTTQHVVLSWALAVAVMAASTVAWAVRDADGRRVVPAQMHLLRTSAAAPRSVGVDLRRLQFFRAASLARRLRIEFHRPVSTGRSAARDSRPLFDVPRVPAGEYRLTPISDRPHGWVMVGVGPDQFALITTSLASHPQPILLRFPITVRNILIRGDEEARQRVSGVVLEPLGVMPAGEWGSDIGRRAVKYGHATVFFLDDRSFPEPEAFWAGGGRSSSYVIQSDDGRPVVAMLVRNGPVANHVTLEVSGAATELDFGPREERRVSIPVDASRGAARVTFKVTGGFHPSDHDPSSRDGRYLGAWVKVE